MTCRASLRQPFASGFIGQTWQVLPSSIAAMPYHVVAFTMAQVRQGALDFQRKLSGSGRELRDVKVYSPSPFALGERQRAKERVGGDVVYFFNDAARDECIRLGLELQFVAQVPDGELPRRRAVVVGLPEPKEQ